MFLICLKLTLYSDIWKYLYISYDICIKFLFINMIKYKNIFMIFIIIKLKYVYVVYETLLFAIL